MPDLFWKKCPNFVSDCLNIVKKNETHQQMCVFQEVFQEEKMLCLLQKWE